MIGTHNSLTCYEARRWFIKPFSFMWKCQDMDFASQLKQVDYFDIRVRFDKHGRIRYCHGLADVNVPYKLSTLLMLLQYHGKKCRILIERGRDNNIVGMVSEYLDNTVDCVIIKKGWKFLYGGLPNMIDYCYVPFGSDRPWWKQLKGVKLSTPRRWARKHNPELTDVMREEETIHFMDFLKEKK